MVTAKRLIGIGDIHASYFELMRLMDKINFCPGNDKLVFVGDYIDRGKDSKAVLEYLSKLKSEYPEQIVLLLGNHEQMAIDALDNGYGSEEYHLWIRNGGETTIKSFRQGKGRRDDDDMEPYLRNFVAGLKPYHVDSGFVFVHAGLPPNTKPQDAPLEYMLWVRDYESYDRTPKDYLGKRIVIGHTPTGSGGKAGVFVGEAIINVDTHCYHSGILSAYDVLNGVEYNSEPNPF